MLYVHRAEAAFGTVGASPAGSGTARPASHRPLPLARIEIL